APDGEVHVRVFARLAAKEQIEGPATSDRPWYAVPAQQVAGVAQRCLERWRHGISGRLVRCLTPRRGIAIVRGLVIPSSWYPAAHRGGISVVRDAELSPEIRLLVHEDGEGYDAQPRHGVEQQLARPKEEHLAQQEHQHTEVHRIAHVSVQAGHDELLGVVD